MELGLENKRILVTGSSRGTGAVIVRFLAREGATVVVHGNTEADQGAIAAEIRSSGGFAHGVTGDLATDEGAAEVVAAVGAVVGGIDVLVNNLGQPSVGKWDNLESRDFIA